MNDIKSFRKKLKDLSKNNTVEWLNSHQKIINSDKKILGIKMAEVRKIAKEISEDMTYQDVKKFIDEVDKNSYEEFLISGLVINYSNCADKEKIALTKKYLVHANSWAEIDSFIGGNKKTGNKLYWDFAVACLGSKKEFTCRFGIVFLMDNFLTDEKIDDVFTSLNDVKINPYYVKMGLAWLYATAAVNYFEKTIAEIRSRLEDGSLELWTYKKSLQKMRESRRFTEEQQEEIASLRKKVAG